MNYLLLALCLTLFFPSSSGFDKTRFLNAARSSEIIVVAEVVESKSSGLVSYWSGTAPSWQRVRYEIKDVLKGNIEKGMIDVGHLVVRNSLTADKEVPRLSPELFKKGNRLILLLQSNRNDCSGSNEPNLNVKLYCSDSENYGAVLNSPKMMKLVRKALNK